MEMTLGELIRGERERQGLTQEELARRSGLHQPTIADIERGRSKLPGPDLRRRLAAALGLRHVDLLVAAGQLLEDEIEAVAPPAFVDYQLREIVEAWPKLRPEARRSFLAMFRELFAMPQVQLDEEEPPVVAVAR